MPKPVQHSQIEGARSTAEAMIARVRRMHAQMERAVGSTHADAAQVKLDKLDVVLALASTSSQDAALFAEMLSLPNDGRYPRSN